jgi:hypothetical protein
MYDGLSIAMYGSALIEDSLYPMNANFISRCEIYKSACVVDEFLRRSDLMGSHQSMGAI